MQCGNPRGLSHNSITCGSGLVMMALQIGGTSRLEEPFPMFCFAFWHLLTDLCTGLVTQPFLEMAFLISPMFLFVVSPLNVINNSKCNTNRINVIKINSKCNANHKCNNYM